MPNELPPDPTPEEFEEWIRPGGALLILHALGAPAAINEILRRAQVGRLLAAGDASWNTSGEDHSVERLIIPGAWWKLISGINIWHHDFWRTGGMTIQTRDRSSYSGRLPVYFFDVRFEPIALHAIPGATPPVSVHAQRTAPPKVIAVRPASTLPKIGRPELTEFVARFAGCKSGRPIQGDSAKCALGICALSRRRNPR